MDFVGVKSLGVTILAENQAWIPNYNSSKIKEPDLSYDPPEYSFTPERYNNEEYALPLKELPENYERDISGKFALHLTDKQKEMLLTSGVVIVPGNNDRFENAYNHLSNSRIYTLNGTLEYDESGIPIIITTDSVLHLFHIEFNELLKNIEINRLSPLLKEFLDRSIKESIAQYNGLNNSELKELARRNVAFLSVAKKLLDPDFDVPGMVKDEVNDEIRRIEDHKGFYRSPLFSKDCPEVCETRLYPGEYDGAVGDGCNQNVKGNVMYEGKVWDFQELYIQVASRKCYCEDYSQYVPRGHYTSSDGLKRYFKSMMWLGRMTFKARGENWTKQAVLLTDAVKSANATGSWNKIYTVTGFFAGASDDLTFYEYDTAVFNLFNYGFDENKELKQQVTEKMQEELGRQRGPKILGGFEFDVAGNLKDTTQGMRVMGQRYALDSRILSDLVYNNVGPNPSSKDYGKVIDYGSSARILTKPPEFYVSCENMDADRVKYWNEVSESALQLFDTGQLTEEQLYGVVRFMPTGLDVMSVLGSRRADEILAGKNISDFCNYEAENVELKTMVKYYNQKTWTENLYNAWLWMLQPVIKEKPKGYPNWMRSELWRNKDLVTGLSSWAQLRHDTILYVKQSYTRATMMMKITSSNPSPMESKYYGYVEPNPELYARAGYITEFLIKGLDEQGVMTDDVRKSLEQSRDMMARLQDISEKELDGRGFYRQVHAGITYPQYRPRDPSCDHRWFAWSGAQPSVCDNNTSLRSYYRDWDRRRDYPGFHCELGMSKVPFVEVCIYEVKPEKTEEFERLLERVAVHHRDFPGVRDVRYMKRTHRQGDFSSVKNGEPPIRLTRAAGSVTYDLYWELDSDITHGKATKSGLEHFFKDFRRCLVSTPKIILGER